MSARKSSHRTIFLIASSGSPLLLIAASLRSTSKKPFCPMTRPLHLPIFARGYRVRFAQTWREEFFEAPYSDWRKLLEIRPIVWFSTFPSSLARIGNLPRMVIVLKRRVLLGQICLIRLDYR